MGPRGWLRVCLCTDLLANLAVAVRRNGAHLGNLCRCRHHLGALLQVVHNSVHRQHNAAAQVHRVDPRRHKLQRLGENGARQDGRRRGAVAGLLVGLVGHVHHQLGAQVLELSSEGGGSSQASRPTAAAQRPRSVCARGGPHLVLELNGLGHGDAILGDLGPAVRLLDNDVAACIGGERGQPAVGTLVQRGWGGAPLGPSVTATASASLLTPSSIAARPSAPKRTSLAAYPRRPSTIVAGTTARAATAVGRGRAAVAPDAATRASRRAASMVAESERGREGEVHVGGGRSKVRSAATWVRGFHGHRAVN
jgi:hypothetical protein